MDETTRQKLLSIAHEVAKEWDALGKECDDNNRFPLQTKQSFIDSTLSKMAVPVEFGGYGADILTVAQVNRILAAGDPAIALAYNMHTAVVGLIRDSAGIDSGLRDRTMQQIADGAIICGPFSEQRAGLTGLADTIAVPQPGGGWKISGKKNWSTLIEAADLIATNATVTDENGKPPADFKDHAAAEMMFILPASGEGISIDRTWDTMGMRATGSQTLVLNAAFAPAESFGDNFRASTNGQAEWTSITFASVYMGLADKAFKEGVAILKKKHLGATLLSQDTDLKNAGHVQYLLGQIYAEKEAAARTLEQTAQMVVNKTHLEWSPMVRRAQLDLAKVMTTEAAIAVSDRVQRLVGGAAFRRGHILERMFRDSRGGPFHPLSTDQAYNYLGRWALGLLD